MREIDQHLAHHGVKGMKWGRRKAYAQAKKDAFRKYEQTINEIEKPYKRGQNLSEEDLAREQKAEDDYKQAIAKAKAEYTTKGKETAKTTNDNYELAYKKAQKGLNVSLALLAVAGGISYLAYRSTKSESISKGVAKVKDFIDVDYRVIK